MTDFIFISDFYVYSSSASKFLPFLNKKKKRNRQKAQIVTILHHIQRFGFFFSISVFWQVLFRWKWFFAVSYPVIKLEREKKNIVESFKNKRQQEHNKLGVPFFFPFILEYSTRDFLICGQTDCSPYNLFFLRCLLILKSIITQFFLYIIWLTFYWFIQFQNYKDK